MSRAGPAAMETMQEAITRLDACGFAAAFRALEGGRLGVRAKGEEASYEAEEMTVEEVVRFEGMSDPDDQAVLFALATPDERFRGTFVAAYGPQVEPSVAAAIDGLEVSHESRNQHIVRGESSTASQAVGDRE